MFFNNVKKSLFCIFTKFSKFEQLIDFIKIFQKCYTPTLPFFNLYSGTATLSVMTFSITTLCVINVIVTLHITELGINDT
jgi:hypothetical protein